MNDNGSHGPVTNTRSNQKLKNTMALVSQQHGNNNDAPALLLASKYSMRNPKNKNVPDVVAFMSMMTTTMMTMHCHCKKTPWTMELNFIPKITTPKII